MRGKHCVYTIDELHDPLYILLATFVWQPQKIKGDIKVLEIRLVFKITHVDVVETPANLKLFLTVLCPRQIFFFELHVSFNVLCLVERLQHQVQNMSGSKQ